jgi:hypothetical protein
MPQKEHPAPLVDSGGRAGTSIAMQRRDTRNSPEKQASERRLQRQRLVQRIYRLGARVTFELLDELGRHHGIEADLDERLEQYAAIDPGILTAVHGDRFPPRPVRVVGKSR